LIIETIPVGWEKIFYKPIYDKYFLKENYIMLYGLKFIYTIQNKEEKISFFYWLLFPLFFSILLYFFSVIHSPEDTTLIFSIIISYIVTWAITLFLLYIYFYFFCKHIKKTYMFETNKKEFGKTIKFLIKNRIFGNLTFPEIISASIFLLYLLELSMIIFLIKDEIYPFAYLFLFFAIIFSIFLNKIRNIIIGIQEGYLKTYSLMCFLVISFLSFFALIFFNGLDTKNWDFSVLLYILSPFIVPIITAVIQWTLLKNKTKQKSERVGWSRLLNFSTISLELLLSFFTVYIIFFFTVSTSVLALGIIFNSVLIIIISLVSIFACIFMIVILPFIFLKNFAHYFVTSIIYWKLFFDCYNNKPMTRLINGSNKLVKYVGKCKAVSINERYRKKIHMFNQHYLLEIEDSKEYVDVISLEEKNPLIFTKKYVKEGEEVKIIGKIKSSLEDETFFPNENRISEFILAYHTEPLVRELICFYGAHHIDIFNDLKILLENEIKHLKRYTDKIIFIIEFGGPWKNQLENLKNKLKKSSEPELFRSLNKLIMSTYDNYIKNKQKIFKDKIKGIDIEIQIPEFERMLIDIAIENNIKIIFEKPIYEDFKETFDYYPPISTQILKKYNYSNELIHKMLIEKMKHRDNTFTKQIEKISDDYPNYSIITIRGSMHKFSFEEIEKNLRDQFTIKKIEYGEQIEDTVNIN